MGIWDNSIVDNMKDVCSTQELRTTWEVVWAWGDTFRNVLPKIGLAQFFSSRALLV